MTESNHTTLVTVVIPTYNRMPLIMEAVDSVIAQTHTNWELFVVDDGSSDDTIAAVKARRHQQIHTIELPHKGLIGPLRNTGASSGTGKWISFLDSDDVWLPQKLELQLKALQQSGLECCYTNFELMDENRNTIPVKAGKFKALSGSIIREVLTTEAAISIGSLMLSRSLFNKCGGFSSNPDLMYRDDYEFALRLALAAKMISLPEILFRVREYSGRGTNSVALPIAHERSSIPYEIFIAGKPAKELQKIAFQQYARHLVMAIKANLKLGNVWIALKQLKKILRLRINVMFGN